jgi:hypothetical protein
MSAKQEGVMGVMPWQQLVRIECHDTEDQIGSDEVYIEVKEDEFTAWDEFRVVWGVVETREGDQQTLVDVSPQKFADLIYITVADEEAWVEGIETIATQRVYSDYIGEGDKTLVFSGGGRGGEYTVTVRVTSEPPWDYLLYLVRLTYHKTKGTAGDRSWPYFTINGQNRWVEPINHDHLNPGETAELEAATEPMPFRTSASVELWDTDTPFHDDELGKHIIGPDENFPFGQEQELHFTYDDANYTLAYRVEKRTKQGL